MSDTTAQDGSIDAIVDSLFEDPAQKEDETTADTEDAAQSDEDNAQAAPEDDAEDVAEADEADADATDDTEDEADADEQDDAEQLYTVKVDGREQQVPLNELLRGYSGQIRIQQGFRDVAEARKEVAAVHHALQSERQQIAEFFRAAETGQVQMRPPERPSEDLITRDPIAYLEASAKYDREMNAYQQTIAVRNEMTRREQEQHEANRRAYMAEQAALLQRHLPAFSKPETAAKAKMELRAAGVEYGFSEDELTAVDDSRMVRVLHDAAQYRRLMAGKASAEKAQQPRTPTLKPGSKPAAPQAGKRTQVEKAKAQMKRTGSVDDVVRYLLT